MKSKIDVVHEEPEGTTGQDSATGAVSAPAQAMHGKDSVVDQSSAQELKPAARAVTGLSKDKAETSTALWKNF